jgi:hypothetical protein
MLHSWTTGSMHAVPPSTRDPQAQRCPQGTTSQQTEASLQEGSGSVVEDDVGGGVPDAAAGGTLISIGAVQAVPRPMAAFLIRPRLDSSVASPLKTVAFSFRT